MSRITKRCKDGTYQLKAGNEIYGEENGIRLVQIVGQVEDLKEELGIDLNIFIKCLTLLNQDKFTYTYVLDKSSDCFMTAITPIQFFVDMEHKEFVQTRRPKGYEQHLKFKDYGIKWALTKEELTDGK